MGDVDALVRLENEVFPTDRLDRRAFRHAVRSPTISTLVATSDGAPLGYAMIHRRRGSGQARLTSIAVSPQASGTGLGKHLLAAAEADARTHGCTHLRLEVRADNAIAQTLYGGAGYRRFDTVEEYYEDGETAWRYAKELAPSLKADVAVKTAR